MMHHPLLLASSSRSRHQLLTAAQIPFTVVEQTADETQYDQSQPFEVIVQSIARLKMAHVTMPAGQEGDVRFVLTADTLVRDNAGTIHGKPVDAADAKRKIEAMCAGPADVATGFCVEKRIYRNGAWLTESAIDTVVIAQVQFDVPQRWIDEYITRGRALQVASACSPEEYGSRFIKWMRGTYSAAVGLPMYEVCQALEQIGFLLPGVF